MPLSARERTRYARHLLLPEVGLAGQERLLETRVALAASAAPEAAEVAKIYLERAGLKLSEGAAASELAQGAAVENDGQSVFAQLPSPQAVEQIAGGKPELLAAAHALSGALAAVEAIKAALGLGSPSDAMNEVRLLPEDA